MPVLHMSDFDLTYDVLGDGTPLVLMSGTATHGDVWKLYQVPEFSRDHKVITYDQRGTGRSTIRGKDFSAKRQAKDVIRLLDDVHASEAVLWGHSMGGRIAQLVALDYPERVKSLILSSTGASFPTGGIPISMCLALVSKGYECYIKEHSAHIGFSKSFAAQNLEIIDAFMKVRLANAPPLELYLRQVIARQEIDTSLRLSQIRVPTLVMVGEDEGHASASGVTHLNSSETLVRGIPGAKLVVIPGQGHYYPFVYPEHTNRAVRDFLASNC